MKFSQNFSSGFTLIEISLIFAIIFIISSFAIFNLYGFQKTTDVNSATDVLSSDLSSQRNRALSGGGSGESYGVYFMSDKYILFKGDSYVSTESSNFEVKLGGNVRFSNSLFPGNTVLFLRKSGEISGYVQGNDSINIQNANGSNSKTLRINKYGTIF